MEDSTLHEIRAALAVAIGSTSLRAVARDVGLSATGLKKFIEGTRPYTPTVQALRRWYRVWHTDDPGRQLLDQVDQLVAQVVHDDRARVRREVLQVIATARLIQPVATMKETKRPRGGGVPGRPGPVVPGRPSIPAGHFWCHSCEIPVPASEWMDHVSRHPSG